MIFYYLYAVAKLENPQKIHIALTMQIHVTAFLSNLSIALLCPNRKIWDV